jgi:hypothetical protein
VTQNGFDSPEAAAMSTFPAEYCSAVATQTQGDNAYVLLNTGPPDRPYLYGVNCHRTDGRWFEGASSNGPGWEQTDHDPDVGTLSCWSDVPMGVDAVRVVFRARLLINPCRTARSSWSGSVCGAHLSGPTLSQLYGAATGNLSRTWAFF